MLRPRTSPPRRRGVPSTSSLVKHPGPGAARRRPSRRLADRVRQAQPRGRLRELGARRGSALDRGAPGRRYKGIEVRTTVEVCCGLRRGRRTPAAGRLESGRETPSSSAGGGRGRRHGADGAEHRHDRGARHRHRHPARAPAADLRAVQSGRTARADARREDSASAGHRCAISPTASRQRGGRERSPGKGATFTVTLPAAPPPAATPRSSGAGRGHPSAHGADLTGVRSPGDDDQDTLELFGAALAQCGASVSSAADATVALRVFGA